MEPEYLYREEFISYQGETIDDIIPRCESEGWTCIFSDMKTTHKTTKFLVHGLFVIVLHDGQRYTLLTGNYNYMPALEGKDSIPIDVKARYNPLLAESERWSKWSNPMRNRKPEAWTEMWRNARSFDTERALHEYILYYMKGFDDIGSTLYWARMPKGDY